MWVAEFFEMTRILAVTFCAIFTRREAICFCFYDNCFCFGQLGATAGGVARHVGMVILFICLLGILARDICGSSCVIVVHVTVYKQIILATVHSSDIIEAAIIFTAVLCNLEPLGELLCFSDIIITIEDGINVCRSVTSRWNQTVCHDFCATASVTKKHNYHLLKRSYFLIYHE